MNTLNDNQVLERAREIIGARYCDSKAILSAKAAEDYFQLKIGGYDAEVFAVLLLNAKHQVIDYKELFHGCVNATSVYVGEIAKYALGHNAVALIIGHNHPAGDCAPSEADKRITKRILDGLKLLDIDLLDHIVVGAKSNFSFCQNGLITPKL